MSNPSSVNRPSFFKPLINKNYSTILRLPISFVRNHRNILPETAKLRIRSGRVWTVKIEETNDDEECFFTDGWSDFVKDLELRRMQLLLFWLNAGDGVFDVSVYDSNSIEREFSALRFRDSMDHTRLNTENVLKFVREVKEHHFKVRRMVLIPKEFGLGIGIATGNIELENSRGRKWPITITSINCAGGFAMTGGLTDFMRENHVQRGDILLFESVPNSVAKVVKCAVMTNEVGKEMFARSLRGGFIKP